MKNSLHHLLVCLALAVPTGPALAQMYRVTGVGIKLNGSPTVNFSGNYHIYIPEEVTQPKGVILIQNGTGEDRSYMAAVGWVQNWARALEYAVIGGTTDVTDSWSAANTHDNLQAILTAAASASGRANLINAPVFAAGHSMGGINSLIMTRQIPSRVVGYAASKAADETPPAPNGYERIFGVWNPGEVDGNGQVHPFRVQQAYQLWRANNSTAAYVLEFNTGHDDMQGQYYDLAFMTSAVAHALRHPGPPPSSAPNSFPALGNFTFSNGWLAERPTFTGNLIATHAMTSRPVWPQIAPVASFTGNAAIASWLPNQLMARVYRAHTSTQPAYVNRIEVPRQNPLQIETPARLQRFRTTDPVFISVDPREWADTTPITKMEFYLNTTKLGEKTNGDWTWDAGPVSTPGIHAIIVEAEGADGTRYAAFTAISVFDPVTSGNFTNTWTGGASSNNMQNGNNWSGGNASWQVVTSGSQSAVETRQIFILNGASANNQWNLSTAGYSQNPSIVGFRFLPAAGANPFTISGWRRIYLGTGGITNLDTDTQVFNNAELYLNGDQIWDAAAGPLLIGNGSMTAIRLGQHDTAMPRFLTFSSVLTITGNHNTTINARLENNGAVIKEGAGTLFLNNNNNTWADSIRPWQPVAQHETLRVHRGAVLLGSNATIAPTTRLFIAQHPTAAFHLNDRPITVGSLNGGGALNLGAASLTINHTFVLTDTNQVINLYVAPSRFRGPISGGVSGNVVLSTRGGSQNLLTTLSGNSSFQGIVQVLSGNLAVGHSNALGASGAGNETILPSGSVLFLNGDGMTIPETLTHNAANTLAIVSQRGNNTWSGPIHFSTQTANPTVQIHNNGANSTLTLSANVTGNQTSGNSLFVQLQPNAPGSGIHVTGGLQNGSAGGNLRVVAVANATTAWVRMSGVSSYTGATQVVRNTFLVGSNVPSSGDGALGNSAGGNIFLGRSGHTTASDNIAFLTDGPVTIGRTVQINNINTSGNITVGGNTGHVSTYSGNIQIDSARAQLALTSATGGNVVISGLISGGASNLVLTKTGPGTVTLARSGGNTYNGQTVVAEGTLLVTNTSSSATGAGNVTVQANARLGGTGTISGNVTMQSGARFAFDLTTNATAHDRMDIGGALALNGNPIDLTSSNNGIAAGNYTLVQAGSISGSPGSVIAPTGFNGTASVVGNQLRVQIQQTLTALEQWRQTHFGSPANSGNGADTADPDGDGVPNLLEYALGGAPTDPASRPLPAVGTTVVSGQNRLTLTFTPQVVTGLTYIVQASDDLATWSDTNVTSSLTPGQPFTFTDTADLATTPRRFLRLRVISN